MRSFNGHQPEGVGAKPLADAVAVVQGIGAAGDVSQRAKLCQFH